MPPVLKALSPTDCEHVRSSDWRVVPEVRAWGSCVHEVDIGKTFARTEQPRRSLRKLNAATPARSPLDDIIETSRAILKLELDEDVAQTPYTEATWTRAVDFLRRNAKWVSKTLGRTVDLPEILPGPDGSIDLHWEYPDYELLINVSADPNAKASFYGDDRGEMSIKGKFDSNTFNHGLLLWLARAK